MVVSKNKVVSIYYTASEAGVVIDTNLHYEPLCYLHGAGNLMPMLETVLEGGGVAETRTIKLPAAVLETNNKQENELGQGEIFHYEITIAAIRPATARELLSGRVLEQPGCDATCDCYR